jgi:hypothetical protein
MVATTYLLLILFLIIGPAGLDVNNIRATRYIKPTKNTPVIALMT